MEFAIARKKPAVAFGSEMTSQMVIYGGFQGDQFVPSGEIVDLASKQHLFQFNFNLQMRVDIETSVVSVLNFVGFTEQPDHFCLSHTALSNDFN